MTAASLRGDSSGGAICRVLEQKRKRRPWTTPWTCGGSLPPLGSTKMSVKG
ncbi:hypothetical protein [Flavonifractor phage Castelnaud]|nr:hypothetical protein [Flavonifractor phage Castelnaud]